MTKGALLRTVFSFPFIGLSIVTTTRPGTLLSLGYFDALFIILSGLYPCAMTKETASLVSVNTEDATTQQPQNLINKHGLCNKKNRCYRQGDRRQIVCLTLTQWLHNVPNTDSDVVQMNSWTA